jgi:hypothetical protein
MSKVNNFDVLKRMCDENMDIRLGTDVVRMDKVKAGTQITMGAPGDCVTPIFLGELVPCLLIYNRKQFNELKATMERQAPDGAE